MAESGLQELILTIIKKIDRIDGRLDRIEEFLHIQTDTMKPIVERLALVEEHVDQVLDRLPPPDDDLISALSRLADELEQYRSPSRVAAAVSDD